MAKAAAWLPGQGGKIWYFIHQGRRSHAAAIIYRLCTFGGVQDKGDIAIFDLIHDIWAAFIDLVHHGAVNAGLSEEFRGS
jgi:hypothetical protein